MDDTTATDTIDDEATTTAPVDTADENVDDGVEEELLIEEVSIDGMCGVY